MSYASSKRPRGERVSRNVAPRSGIARWWVWLRDPDILRRLGISFLAALVMWIFAGAWQPSFPFRSGYVELRLMRLKAGRTRAFGRCWPGTLFPWARDQV